MKYKKKRKAIKKVLKGLTKTETQPTGTKVKFLDLYNAISKKQYSANSFLGKLSYFIDYVVQINSKDKYYLLSIEPSNLKLLYKTRQEKQMDRLYTNGSHYVQIKIEEIAVEIALDFEKKVLDVAIRFYYINDEVLAIECVTIKELMKMKEFHVEHKVVRIFERMLQQFLMDTHSGYTYIQSETPIEYQQEHMLNLLKAQMENYRIDDDE